MSIMPFLLHPRVLAGRVRNEGERVTNAFKFKFASPSRPKVLILNHTGRCINWGCVATCNGLVSQIERSYVNPVIVKRFFRGKFHVNDIQLPESNGDWDTYLQDRRFSRDLDRFEDADVIILNGEGTMHEWEDKNFMPEPYMLLMEMYAATKLFKKPVMVLNQSVYYHGDDFGDWVTRAYQDCNFISVREPNSLRRLQALGLMQTKLIPDSAFLTGSVSKDKATAFLAQRGVREGYIGLFLGETVARADIEKIIDLIERIKVHYAQKKVVVFAAPYPDPDVAKKLKSKTDVTVIGMEAYPEMMVGVLKLASMVLSGRYHPCIFTVLAGVPLITFRSSTDKNEGLIELLNYPITETIFEDISNENIINMMNWASENRAQLDECLQKNVPPLVATTLDGYPNILSSSE